MLLTSGQVSLAISSFIIFIFTTALFLSGYVLQQQTVRDLRAAIQPQLVKTPPTGADLYLPPQFRDKEYWEAKGVVDAMLQAQERAKAEVRDGGGVMHEEGEGKEEDRLVGATRWQKKRAREGKRKLSLKNGKSGGEQKVLEGVESELVEAESEAQEQPVDAETERPQPQEEHLSPAERRRRIKEQILAEGEGDGFKGYRRRMW